MFGLRKTSSTVFSKLTVILFSLAQSMTCATAVTNNNFVQCPCNSHCDSVTLIFAFVCMYVSK